MNATIIWTHASVGFEDNRVPALTTMEDTRAAARAAFVDSPVNLVSRGHKQRERWRPGRQKWQPEVDTTEGGLPVPKLLLIWARPRGT